MSYVLLIDFGSTYTKITAVQIETETVIGTAYGFTTVETGIMDGLEKALKQLFDKTGTLTFDQVLGCSSAAGGLKMVAIGLVPELTAEAARRTALGAGAKVQAIYSHELNEYEVSEIAGLAPDIILLAGGTDGGNKQVILHNAAMLAKLDRDVPIVVAGNKSVASQAVRILSETMSHVVHTENVMPRLNELNIEPARQAIRDIFLKRIVKAKGLDQANRFINRMVMPTPAAVLQAVTLLGTGTHQESGLGELMAIDIGGATTDIYSVAKGEPLQSNVALRGLPEPFAKRTVEGDLGMRYSVSALLQAAGTEKIAGETGITTQEISRYIDQLNNHPDYLPQREAEEKIELALAKMCVALGTERHVGQIETVYTMNGAAAIQTGKDLTGIKTVIGTGGVIVSHPEPKRIMEGVCFEPAMPFRLKPQHPDYYLDQHYILAAMGLLSEDYPDIALRMIKKYIVRRL